jgi:NAD(P)-dependent dehydrogenase (short-subunit alcohol dehydrogenase family)
VSSTQSPRGVALVTGAARGIGRSLALAAAGCGYDLAVHYRASEADALETVAQATALGVHAEALRASTGQFNVLIKRRVDDHLVRTSFEDPSDVVG